MVAYQYLTQFLELYVELGSIFGVKEDDSIVGDDDADGELVVGLVNEVSSGAVEDGFGVLGVFKFADVGGER